MGPADWIPAFRVPALLVTNYITFVVVAKHWARVAGGRTGRRNDQDWGSASISTGVVPPVKVT
jgi:hypothetical protein